jgi:hypothetical protein
MVDVIVVGVAVAAALAGVVGLIKPLVSSLLAKRVDQSKEMKITVKSPDGTFKELVVESSGTEPLKEDQLKQILKLLSEADHGRAETDNSKK